MPENHTKEAKTGLHCGGAGGRNRTGTSLELTGF